jgi:hypothetical protein
MKRFLIILLTGIAVALGTASTAQAHDRCYRPSYSHSRSHCYTPRYYSSGYCAPRTYYYSQPRYYSSYNCAPRYYSSPCYTPRYYSSRSCYRPYGGVSISVPGFGLFFGR